MLQVASEFAVLVSDGKPCAHHGQMGYCTSAGPGFNSLTLRFAALSLVTHVAAPVAAAVNLSLRLRGGGGDGGSTGAESRSSYLEMYKERKEEKVSSCACTYLHELACASLIAGWNVLQIATF